jgi:hypothetical protein
MSTDPSVSPEGVSDSGVVEAGGEGGAEIDGGDHGQMTPEGGGGPVLGLLARGLELWLRQQCDVIDAVQIQLRGSALQLLRGRLEGVSLTARGVIYEAMEIAHVELCSGPIRVRMGPLLRHQTFELENAFPVSGVVGFRGEGLDRSLRSPRWQGLAGELMRDVLGSAGLGGVKIEGDRLWLIAAEDDGSPPHSQADPQGAGDAGSRTVGAMVSAVDGTLELRAVDGGRRTLLTMDPNIRIHRAEVSEGWLRLTGEAQVSP